MELTVLNGLYEKTLYRDEKTGFTIFSLRVKRGVENRSMYGTIVCTARTKGARQKPTAYGYGLMHTNTGTYTTQSKDAYFCMNYRKKRRRYTNAIIHAKNL
jgi:hypothetical protein